jgi:hypothetical protein
MLVALVGAKFVLDEYRANKPDKIWMPFTLSQDLLPEEHEAFVKKTDESLRKEKILKQVVIDTKLRDKLKLATDEEAIKDLNRRLFVELDSADTPQGSITIVNVGVKGIRRENKLLKDLCARIARDFFILNGIDPKTGKPIE